ncbi:hypothetical protein TNCV_3810131 [Trichonephila clavipes]|nr:hypothetical protein TNCV_3810131 [Trichonephila clavipes]
MQQHGYKSTDGLIFNDVVSFQPKHPVFFRIVAWEIRRLSRLRNDLANMKVRQLFVDDGRVSFHPSRLTHAKCRLRTRRLPVQISLSQAAVKITMGHSLLRHFQSVAKVHVQSFGCR